MKAQTPEAQTTRQGRGKGHGRQCRENREHSSYERQARHHSHHHHHHGEQQPPLEEGQTHEQHEHHSDENCCQATEDQLFEHGPQHGRRRGCRHGQHQDEAHTRGYRKHRMLPLTSATLGVALRDIARKHGYIASRGPHAGNGNPSELAMALAKGDVATVWLDANERQHIVEWLETQAETLADSPLSETIRSLSTQLKDAEERKRCWNTQNES